MQHQPWNYCGTCSAYANAEASRLHPPATTNFGTPPSILMPAQGGGHNQAGVVYSPEAPVVYTDNPEGFKYQQTMIPCSQGMTGIKFCPPMVFPPPENQCDAHEAAICGGPAGLHELLGWPMFSGQHNSATRHEDPVNSAPMPSMVKGSVLGPPGHANVHTVGGVDGCPKVSIISTNGSNINGSNLPDQVPLEGPPGRPSMAMDPGTRGGSVAMDPVVRASVASITGGMDGNLTHAGAPGPLSELNGINKDNLCHIIYVYRH